MPRFTTVPSGNVVEVDRLTDRQRTTLARRQKVMRDIEAAGYNADRVLDEYVKSERDLREALYTITGIRSAISIVLDTYEIPHKLNRNSRIPDIYRQGRYAATVLGVQRMTAYLDRIYATRPPTVERDKPTRRRRPRIILPRVRVHVPAPVDRVATISVAMAIGAALVKLLS